MNISQNLRDFLTDWRGTIPYSETPVTVTTLVRGGKALLWSGDLVNMIIIKLHKLISYILYSSLLVGLFHNTGEVRAADWAIIALDKCLPTRGQVQAGSGGMVTRTAKATVKCALDRIPSSIEIHDVFVRLRRASVATNKKVICWMSTGQSFGQKTQDIGIGVARDTTLNQSVTIPVFSQKRPGAVSVSCRLHQGDRFYGVHYQYSATSAKAQQKP